MSAQWMYVVGAYGVTLGGLLGLAWFSFHALRGAESRVERKDRP